MLYSSLRAVNSRYRLQFPCRAFSSIIKGSKYTTEYSNYLKLPNGKIGSYFHDVDLGLDLQTQTVNMVVEVPRWTNGKFEISKGRRFNPIKQDIKNGMVRFVHNIFPFKGYIHNYGAIPQTWENPEHESLHGLKGDNDPLDCCEIGSAIHSIGNVRRVKILGSLALIDDGELDWKIIVIDINDPMSKHMKNISDVKRYYPGILEATREWFRKYKIPSGKPENQFAFEGQYRDVAEAISVIEGCHSSWKQLISGEIKHDNIIATDRATFQVEIAPEQLPDADIPAELNKWHYV
ncbi:HGR069Wp [Eremothecium sinecaudum]|uniref:inorganic diphosphatase n=1 Tax=Eremothecium sinecaudum TaxID=45286 RepID=A0A109V035_9SACH|nr:HGR069Wp [Eremothecium sinecaudum]AMD22408.1 HGR069Wp [Eremothecium sinecaudum]